MIGERIGEYELESPLGQGAMGVVYQARRGDGVDQVAMKIAHAEISADPEKVALVEDEFRATASVEHAHVVPVYERGKHQDRPFIVMPYVDGSTLGDLDYRKRFYEPAKLRKLMVRVASAIAAIHRKDLVHCDLGPNNILINEEDRPYIIDFGGAWAPWLSKRPRTIFVTPSGYAPPEFGEAEPKPTSDVFTFGAVFIELVHEARANFRASGLAKRQGLRLLSHLEAICNKAKQPKAADRYRSGVELALELDILQRVGSIEPQSWTVAFIDWAYGHRLLVAALSVLSLLAMYMPWALFALESTDLGERTKSVEQLNQKVAKIRAEEMRAEIERITKLVHAIAALPEVAELVADQRKLLDSSGALSTQDALSASALLEREIAKASVHENTKLDSLFLLNRNCEHLARFPAYEQAQYRHGPFDWRDYCSGISKLGLTDVNASYVSRVYAYPIDPRPNEKITHRFAIAVPVPREDGPAILVATLDSGSTFGRLAMPGRADDGAHTSVVAPQDKNRREDELPTKLISFAHRYLSKGGTDEPWTVDKDDSATECLAAAAGKPKGPSSSVTAIAEIPGTHFVVCESTPLGRSLESQQARQERLEKFLILPAMVALGLCGALVVLSSINRNRKGR